jgi:nicotinamide riboside kinase
MRVGFSGGPGSGKSVLARRLAGSLVDTPIKVVEMVPEYARRYINKYGPIEHVYEQMRILKKQLDWENSIPKEVELVISDSPIFLGWAYVMDLRKWGPRGELAKETLLVSDIFSEMNRLNSPKRYDVIFHLPPLLDPVDDGTREEGQLESNWLQKIDENLRAAFKIFPPIKFHVIESTNMDERLAICKMEVLNLWDVEQEEKKIFEDEVKGTVTKVLENRITKERK